MRFFRPFLPIAVLGAFIFGCGQKTVIPPPPPKAEKTQEGDATPHGIGQIDPRKDTDAPPPLDFSKLKPADGSKQ